MVAELHGPSVSFQTRVPRGLAAQLPDDMAVLGLEDRSAVVRYGLQLVHEKAQLARLEQEYVDLYGDGLEPASPVAQLLGGTEDDRDDPASRDY